MRPSWSGSISFGLVNVPVALFSATRSERISFNLLHKKDMGRVGFVRKCKFCGKELSQDDIVKGFEVDKDEYIEVTDKDFEKAEAAIETGHTIQIIDFVKQDEIDPKFFEAPYYIVPGKDADHTYVLLREALKKTKMVGVARMVFRDREHLAAIKPDGRALMLDTMHFAEEINEGDELDIPKETAKVNIRELEMAQKLIGMMSGRFNPDKYKDNYRDALLDLIEKKAKGVEVEVPPRRKSAATNVVDIMSKLKSSLEKSGERKTVKAKTKRSTTATRPRHAVKKKAKAA
jgi:DNA end-binding protein Ku